MTGNEKFQLEFTSTEELCELCRYNKKQQRELEAELKHHDKFSPAYAPKQAKLWEIKQRIKYIESRIHDRQLKLL